jgi:predicted DNA-binding antitoxin AbrB/MazE fold protein
MSHDIRAVFDKGVFRPLEPLDLPDGTCVQLRVDEEKREITMDGQVDPAELEQQQRALQAMFREVDRLPQTANRDGHSGRDHDYILYGSQK